jgi:hypothetical protein
MRAKRASEIRVATKQCVGDVGGRKRRDHRTTTCCRALELEPLGKEQKSAETTRGGPPSASSDPGSEISATPSPSAKSSSTSPQIDGATPRKAVPGGDRTPPCLVPASRRGQPTSTRARERCLSPLPEEWGRRPSAVAAGVPTMPGGRSSPGREKEIEGNWMNESERGKKR